MCPICALGKFDNKIRNRREVNRTIRFSCICSICLSFFELVSALTIRNAGWVTSKGVPKASMVIENR